MDVGEWLGGLGLQQYAKAFAENGIDYDVLQNLTGEDLKELGVELLGHRRKLLTAIEALHSRPAAVPAPGRDAQMNSPPAQTSVSPQRRHLTVLFCDLVGSTALSARLDPEDLRDVIRRYHATVAEMVHSQGGFVAQYLGDGALIYFGFPTAHEDDVERAVRTALLICKATQSIEVKGGHLQVRAGLATGLVVVGDRAEGSEASHEPQVMGETPNRAARLQALAEPNGIVIDATTRRLIGRMFELRERAAATLTGFDSPVQYWDVIGEAAIDSRFEALRSGETPLIGRDEELNLLMLRWQQAKKGAGRVVLISGEPGLGKSRLVSAFQERIKAERALQLRYFCSPQHTSTALYPIATHLSRVIKFAGTDTPEQMLEKLRPFVENPEDLPFIADLLSLPVAPDAGFDELAPQERRQKLFAALSTRITALAKSGPLFILLEDAHWIDPTTQELIDYLVSRIGKHPALLLITCRQEYQPSWIGDPSVTNLVLNRLAADDCTALIRALTANGQLPPEMIDEIAARTDGIPLFAEELSKALMDVSQKDARKHASAAELHVPDTLHASLIARLDHLGAEARETAQAGSVIGREFSHALLRRMAATSAILAPQTIDSALDALVGSGLIFVRGTAPDSIYTFKHSLVQDAAYATLLRAQRQKLHAALASIMEKDERVAPEVLAAHFAGAGESEKAAEQWFKAGQAANERSANLEAIRSFRNALDLISSLPATRERKLRMLEITGALCNPMVVAKWLMSETTEVITKAARLAEELGVRPPAVILYHQYLHHTGSSNHQEALRIIELFREEAGPEFLTRAESGASTSISMSGGSLETALERNARALAAYDRRKHAKQRFHFTYEPRGITLSGQSLQLALRGYFEQAKAAEREAVSCAAEVNHPQTIGNLLGYKLVRAEYQQDYSEHAETADSLLRHAKEHGIVFWSLWSDIFRGFASARAGDPLPGIQMIDKALKIFTEMKFTYYRPFHLSLKARAYGMAGDIESARATLSEAIAFAEASGEKVVLAELLRLSGELHLTCSGAAAADTAEHLFTEAIASARVQASNLHELRAATSLARLWQKQSKYEDAERVLRPVYDWFSEGLGAPDLVNARAVLAGAVLDAHAAELRHEHA
jgi:class 3 adenylate cyclase/predicted ATPase